MASRFLPRLLVSLRVLPRLPFKALRRRPLSPQRILVAHHLLLGDTLMLAPLLKKLRRDHPVADIAVLCPIRWLPLFAASPYGARALAYDPRSASNHRELFRAGPFDWALVPADNRWSWLAMAMGARWITAFTGAAPAYKNWPVDERLPWPDRPSAWGDIAATLAPGAEPTPFQSGEWPAPPRPERFPELPRPYAVLHLGASSPHKLWEPDKWRAVAAWAEAQGIAVVLSAGPGEGHLVASVDEQGHHLNLSGRLDLAALWHVLAGARFLVCPDTGIAHLARLTGTPTVALFGPGSPVVSGPGRFWRSSPFVPVWIEEIRCRDQDLLFGRKIAWVRHCWRSPEECKHAVCMSGIGPTPVLEALKKLLGDADAKSHER